MNVIQIFLKTSGSIAELYKDFNLYKGLYRNTQIFVYVPKSILYNEDGFTNSVKTGAILTTPNGSQITTQSYFTLYLQDETVNGIEYSVYTQVMPKIFAQYAGTQTIVVNVSSTDSNESTPQIVAITTSQTAQLIVMNSAYLDQDEPIDPSQTEIIQGQINELGERIDENKTQIEANAAAIAKNTEDISTNAANIVKNTEDIAEINEKLPDIEQDAADAVEAAKQAAASAEAAQSDAAAAAASANASAASASQANNSAIAANNSAIAAANSAAQIEDMKTTFALKDESASSLEVSLNNATFVLTMTLKDVNGNTLSTQTVDFPIESMVVGISYNEATKTLIFQLQSGETLEVPIDDIIEGLATQAALDDVIDGTTPVAKATEADTAGKVNNALTVTIDGVQNTYDGSEAVSVVINTTSNTDPEAVHFTSQTLNESQQSQARENIGAASVAEMNAGDDKSYFNLGAYDTYVDNGDGTVTVTRKTGYYQIDGNFTANYIWSDFKNMISVEIPNVDYDTTLVASIKTSQDVWNNGNPVYDYEIEDHISNDEGHGVRLVVKNATSQQEFRDYVSQHPIYIQYELATSEQYTENLIAETPINTLDANMSDIVRDEVEKTLNLLEIDESEFTEINNCSLSYSDGIITMIPTGSDPYATIANLTLPAGEYTVSLITKNSAQISVTVGPTMYASLVKNSPIMTFRVQNESIVKIRIDGEQNGTVNPQTFSVMLVEGNHAYPYQPYNGAIVHEKQLNAALEGYIQFIGTITDINNASIGEYQKPFYGFVNSNTGNAPTTSGGTLFTNNHSATYASQQYITDTGRFYMRDKQEGTWNAWKQIANQDWVQANYLPLTGGTINGDLNVLGQVQEAGQRVYSPNNPPPYPVTSVNGMDGAVNVRLYTHIVTLRGNFDEGKTESDIDPFGVLDIRIAVQSTDRLVWSYVTSIPEGIYPLFYSGSGQNGYRLLLTGSLSNTGDRLVAIASGYAADSGNFNHYLVSARAVGFTFVSDEVLT